MPEIERSTHRHDRVRATRQHGAHGGRLHQAAAMMRPRGPTFNAPNLVRRRRRHRVRAIRDVTAAGGSAGLGAAAGRARWVSRRTSRSTEGNLVGLWETAGGG